MDWAKIGTSLGLKGQTATALAAFKKRNDDARRKVQLLSDAPQTVNFESYRSQLKNQAVIDEIENHFKNFKPATYDVSRQIKAIEAFEAQAVKNAEETKGLVDKELGDLEQTLKNIEEARPFEDLTVVCVFFWFRSADRKANCWVIFQDEVVAARPDIDERTTQLVSRGRWSVPGYKVGCSTSQSPGNHVNHNCRRNSAICLSYRCANVFSLLIALCTLCSYYRNKRPSVFKLYVL